MSLMVMYFIVASGVNMRRNYLTVLFSQEATKHVSNERALCQAEGIVLDLPNASRPRNKLRTRSPFSGGVFCGFCRFQHVSGLNSDLSQEDA